jgi:hypothetical protein
MLSFSGVGASGGDETGSAFSAATLDGLHAASYSSFVAIRRGVGCKKQRFAHPVTGRLVRFVLNGKCILASSYGLGPEYGVRITALQKSRGFSQVLNIIISL